MGHCFYKHKLLFDENMPSRVEFPRLNGLFDVKHVRDDLGSGGIADPDVYALAVKLQRLIGPVATLLSPAAVGLFYVNVAI